MLALKQCLVERLYSIHEDEFIFEETRMNNKKRKLYKSVFMRPLLKILMFLIICFGFFIGMIYGPESISKELFTIQIHHTCFGGMRRMLSPLTLFWGRESLLEASNLPSYIQTVPDFQVSTSYSEMISRNRQFTYIQTQLMNSLKDTVQSKYSFSRYLSLMKGDACNIITTISNCSQTIVGCGVDIGTKIYLQELQIGADIAKYQGFMASEMIKIEKYSKNIEKSYVFGLQVYTNYTNELIIQQENSMMITTVFFFIATLL